MAIATSYPRWLTPVVYAMTTGSDPDDCRVGYMVQDYALKSQ